MLSKDRSLIEVNENGQLFYIYTIRSLIYIILSFGVKIIVLSNQIFGGFLELWFREWTSGIEIANQDFDMEFLRRKMQRKTRELLQNNFQSIMMG